MVENNNEKVYSIGSDYLKKLPNQDYIIGPGDRLSINVARDYVDQKGNPELLSKGIVDGEGTINLPKLNRVYVRGLSINELKSLLNKEYKKFVKYPSVEIEVIDYRPIRIFVQGEVANPGAQTLPGSISISMSKSKNIYTDNNFFPTVFDAIRESGGITQYSDLSNVQVIRMANLSSGGGKISTILNFKDVLTVGDESQNIRIYDGDIINIRKTKFQDKQLFGKASHSNLNPKFLEVSVYGRVKNPGTIKVPRSGVLSDAIDIAGGTKVLKGPLTYLRFNNDGTIEKRKFRYNKRAKRGTVKNPYLAEGDLIVIGESALSVSTEIINEITAPFASFYSAYGLYKLLND